MGDLGLGPRSAALWARAGATLLVLVPLAGCSLTLDAERKACSKNTDCGAPYVCSAGLCQQKTDCQDDAECRDLGGGAYANTFCDEGVCRAAECMRSASECDDGLVCDTLRNRCLEPSATTCGGHEECARYGLALCSDGTCEPAECEDRSDCPASSPTMECVEGRCEDKVWGCAGEPDERPEPMSATATFKVEIVDLLQRKRIPDLQISLCSSVDTLCQTPLREPVIDYDEDGIVTVTGLPQNTPLHFKLEAEGFITSDYYVQRLARDLTVEPQGIQLLPSALYGALSDSLGVEADLETKATFNALFLDCQDKAKPGADVTLQIDNRPEDMFIFYVRDGNQPDVSLDRTTVIGAAGAVNVPSGRQLTIKGYVGEQLISSYAITPYAKRMTYVTMYPRVYTVQ